jgi:hypothetical protein
MSCGDDSGPSGLGASGCDPLQLDRGGWMKMNAAIWL